MRTRTVLLLIAAGWAVLLVGFGVGVSTVAVFKGLSSTWSQRPAASDPARVYRVALLQTLLTLGSIEPVSPAEQGVYLAKLSPESMTATGFVADWVSTSFTEYSSPTNASPYKQAVAFNPEGFQFYVLKGERPRMTLMTPHFVTSRDFWSIWNSSSADSQQMREGYWWVVLDSGRCYVLMQAPGDFAPKLGPPDALSAAQQRYRADGQKVD